MFDKMMDYLKRQPVAFKIDWHKDLKVGIGPLMLPMRPTRWFRKIKRWLSASKH